jgi:hypothetical protein
MIGLLDRSSILDELFSTIDREHFGGKMLKPLGRERSPIFIDFDDEDRIALPALY